MNALFGYCRKQATIYGVKGNRLRSVKNAIKWLEQGNPEDKLNIFEEKYPFPTGLFLEIVKPDKSKWKFYSVNGRMYQETVRVSYMLDKMIELKNSYGKRATKAEENEGIDWKAVSHAFRVGFQMRELYSTGELSYPVPEHEFVRDIKLGKYHYIDDELDSKLGMMVGELKLLADLNFQNFPETVDEVFFNNWLVNEYSNHVLKLSKIKDKFKRTSEIT